MNKKYLNIVLIVLLVFIWGSVLYKYFGSKSFDVQTSSDMALISPAKANFSVAKDSFVLILNDKDPFGISKRRNKPPEISKPSNLGLKKKSEPKNVVWPSISYYGFVRGEQKATRLVLIKVNNRVWRKRETEKIDEVTIVKAFSDSVIVSFNKQHKTIKRINEKI